MDLKDIVAIVWKRRMIVAMVTIVAVVLAGLFAFTRTKQYQATTTLAMTPNVQRGQGFVASDDLSTLLSTYAAIVQSSITKGAAAQRLGHPLHATISASTTAGTGVLKIAATSTSPQEAAAASNALSQAFVAETATRNSLLVVQVVDPPTVPTSAVAPRPPLIIGSALILGLGLGIALALIMERWFDRIESATDIREVANLATLARIPRNRRLDRERGSSLVWNSAELFDMQEAFRTLRTSLQFSTSSERDVIQVTSPGVGEGKSTVAANLAIAIASVGTLTVLVDADVRAPRQHTMFNLSNDRGLSTTVAEDSRADNLPLQRTEFKNLHVLTSGPALGAPTEALAAQVDRLIKRLRGLRATVVIDTPPVLAVSDARLVAPKVDLVLLVVSADMTKSSTLRAAMQHLEMSQSRVAGAVLNRSRESADMTAYGVYQRQGEPQIQSTSGRNVEPPVDVG